MSHMATSEIMILLDQEVNVVHITSVNFSSLQQSSDDLRLFLQLARVNLVASVRRPLESFYESKNLHQQLIGNHFCMCASSKCVPLNTNTFSTQLAFSKIFLEVFFTCLLITSLDLIHMYCQSTPSDIDIHNYFRVHLVIVWQSIINLIVHFIAPLLARVKPSR